MILGVRCVQRLTCGLTGKHTQPLPRPILRYPRRQRNRPPGLDEPLLMNILHGRDGPPEPDVCEVLLSREVVLEEVSQDGVTGGPHLYKPDQQFKQRWGRWGGIYQVVELPNSVPERFEPHRIPRIERDARHGSFKALVRSQQSLDSLVHPARVQGRKDDSGAVLQGRLGDGIADLRRVEK